MPVHDTREDDHALLAAFARSGDERDFQDLVNRYIDLVYASAKRQVRSATLAEDVTQAVFILLARKAGSIVGRRVLAGWLINAARLCAQAAARREARHIARERKAAAMRSESLQSEPPADAADIRPFLDEGLAALREGERSAIVLRYLQGRPLQEVAAILRISEAAATKRVARGTQRMRHYFARRGIVMAPAAVGEALLRHASVSTPAHLASAATSAGMGVTRQSATTPPSLIADAAASSSAMPLKILAAAAAALLFIGVLAVITTRATTPPQSAIGPATTSTAAIRVGFFLSHLSATNPSLGNKPGYGMRSMEDLKDSAFEIIPIIEPDTAHLGDLPAVLASYFPKHKPLNAADADQLKSLDVMIAGSTSTPLDVLDAMEIAVEQHGVGLMTRNQFSMNEPRFTPQVMKLYGLQEASYGVTQNAVECDVLVEHPVISSRKGKPGAPVRMRLNGVFGVPARDVTPLIKAKEFDLTFGEAIADDRAGFFPVYVHTLGAGRVVHCCYATFDTPRNISDSVGPQFMTRAIKWLARRPVE